MIGVIQTPNAPLPAGHYSQAVLHEGLVYIAGQLPIDPATGNKVLGTIEEQTERTLLNLKAIVEAAGTDLAHVLKVTVYIADVGQWGAVNGVYARFFGAWRPARSVVPTKELHHGFLIEIDAIAALP
jgi:2-iminobutanoate/2-iminopropanoate deaminase